MNNQNRQIEELDILKRAIEILAIETGVQIEIQETEVLVKGTDSYRADALLTIGPNKKDIFVEIKRHAQHINFGAIINQIQRLPGKAMFVADYINPNMAEELKQQNIQFIDTVGNAFINLDPIYILITGKKQDKKLAVHTGDHANRAFEPKGLMVTYAILTDPNLLNLPYREIAAATDVARGTVGWVINALKAGRYIHDEAKTKNRRITNYQRLLDRWVEAWPEKLKPKQFLGTFIADEPYWWQDVNIQDYDGYWGGETAGALYTHYLKPEIATVYIPKVKHTNLIRDMRFRKADGVNHLTANKVHLYTPFWPKQEAESLNTEDTFAHVQLEEKNKPDRIKADPGLVNPVLVYADLIATGDTRNIEAAKTLYDERIA